MRKIFKQLERLEQLKWPLMDEVEGDPQLVVIDDNGEIAFAVKSSPCFFLVSYIGENTVSYKSDFMRTWARNFYEGRIVELERKSLEVCITDLKPQLSKLA